MTLMDGNRLKRERVAELMVGVFLFAVLFAWGFVQPITEQPDERCRYVIPYFIYSHGRLPVGTEAEVIMSTYGISYAFFPGLPYIFMALFMKITSFFTTNAYVLLMSARVVNMLAGIGAYCFIRKTAKKLFAELEAGWLFTLAASFWPQVLFIFTYVNCDAFAYLSCSVMVYALVSGLYEGWTRKNYVTLAVGVSVCALSYYNAYGMIVASVLIFVLSFFRGKKERQQNQEPAFDVKGCLRIGVTIVFICLVLAGWWFIRNMVLYDGDLFGMEANRKLAEVHAIDAYKPSMKVTLKNSGNPWYCLIVNEQFRFLLKQSFFARFGNMTVLAPNYIIRGFKMIVFIGAIGLLLPNRKKTFTGIKRAAFAAGMLIEAGITLVLTYWYSYASDYQPQGRYLLPAVIPLLCITCTGIQNITVLIKHERFKWLKARTMIVRILYAGSMFYIAISTIGCVRLIWRQYGAQLSETLGLVFHGGPI